MAAPFDVARPTPRPRPVRTEIAPNGLRRYDFEHRWGPPHGWVGFMAQRYPKLAIDYTWSEDMFGVAGRVVIRDGIEGSAEASGFKDGSEGCAEFEASCEGGGFPRCFSEAGWPLDSRGRPIAYAVAQSICYNTLCSERE